MREPARTLLLLVALMATGCRAVASEAPGEAIAVQADRVGDLLDEQRSCEAVEALRTLEELADTDTRPEVREAVATFVASARSEVACEPTPEPAPEEDPEPGDQDGGPPPGVGEGRRDDEDRDEGRGEDEAEGGGNGTEGHERDEEARGRGGDGDDSDDGGDHD